MSSFQELNSDDEEIPLPSITILAKVPERMNNIHCIFLALLLTVQSTKLNWTVSNSAKKIQVLESIDIETSGNINFNGCTVRANHIQLNTNHGGTIHTRKTLEAQKLQIQSNDGGRVRCQKINASTCSITVHNTTDTPTNNNNNNDNNALLDKDDEGAIIDISSLYTAHTGTGADLYVDTTNRNNNNNDGVNGE